MKLSKYAKLVKEGGYCLVIHAEDSGIWLGTRAALFRATELPDMVGEEQVRTVLDIPEKAWEKVHLEEKWVDSVHDIFGLNLSDFETGEQDTTKLKMLAAPDGLWCACRRRADTGELIFYQEKLLYPIGDQIKDSDYIRYTARRTAAGQPYLVVHDGFEVLAAVMPVQVVTEEYLADLSDFQALCTEQFYRERSRGGGGRERGGRGSGKDDGADRHGGGRGMNGALLSSKKMDYCTPRDFFAELDQEFHFTLDAAATEASAKCPAYYTPETDGLNSPWNIAGGGCCILQPAVWPRDREVGTQGLGGGKKRDDHCAAYSSPDRHQLFSRVHLRTGGNPMGPRATPVRGRGRNRVPAGAVPVYGGGLQREGVSGHES